ncbi:hypothetical protein KEH51_00700 [[Brevibacterium] frigoritolerans]|uniref:Uncharacterized protein n=1 Tax=Peribacillus frigoritolerans TaxID=450367 RepID=A0A941FI40_9BACI|nr:hypothetical protein [Peribacillus frigoritolerans]
MTNEKEQVETGGSQVTGESTIQTVNDGHYHYPGPVEEGYSGNTGRAVQPAGKKILMFLRTKTHLITLAF